MSNGIPTIDYHAARAMEELERAEAAASDISRRTHMELSGLHLRRAAQLQAVRKGAPALTVVRALDSSGGVEAAA